MFGSKYDLGSEKSDEEKDLFWGKINECLSSFRQNIRVIVLGDLNACVGNESVMDIIGKYGGEELIRLCLER